MERPKHSIRNKSKESHFQTFSLGTSAAPLLYITSRHNATGFQQCDCRAVDYSALPELQFPKSRDDIFNSVHGKLCQVPFTTSLNIVNIMQIDF